MSVTSHTVVPGIDPPPGPSSKRSAGAHAATRETRQSSHTVTVIGSSPEPVAAATVSSIVLLATAPIFGRCAWNAGPCAKPVSASVRGDKHLLTVARTPSTAATTTTDFHHHPIYRHLARCELYFN